MVIEMVHPCYPAAVPPQFAIDWVSVCWLVSVGPISMDASNVLSGVICVRVIHIFCMSLLCLRRRFRKSSARCFSKFCLSSSSSFNRLYCSVNKINLFRIDAQSASPAIVALLLDFSICILSVVRNAFTSTHRLAALRGVWKMELDKRVNHRPGSAEPCKSHINTDIASASSTSIRLQVGFVISH